MFAESAPSRMSESGPLAVLVAKQPRPGRVKTRLVGERWSAEQAAEIATAMLEAIVIRLRTAFDDRLAIAVTPDGVRDLGLPAGIVPASTPWLDQGSGDLGARLLRLWRGVADGPGRHGVLFFGMDSPDVPAAALQSARDTVAALLRDNDPNATPTVAAGPTIDGGYWTIGGGRPVEVAFRDIDWGSAFVYDQTTLRLREAGGRVVPLPAWSDIDESGDVDALLGRLRHHAEDAALTRLADRLERIAASCPAPS